MAMMPPPVPQTAVPPPVPGAGMPPPDQQQQQQEQKKVPPSSVLETAHVDMVHDAQMDYYGRRLATCSSDRTIKIFRVGRDGSHRHEATLEGHDGPVWQVCWSHPTRHGRPMLASASHDGRVIIWMEEAPTVWRKYFEYSWHASSVNSVAFAPAEYGLIFACASSDGFVSICSQLQDGTWDERRVSEATDGAAHTHPLGAMSVSWAPAVAPGGLWMTEHSKPPPMQLVSGGCDHLVKVWRFDDSSNNWQLSGKVLKAHRDMVRSVAWAPNIGLPRSIIATAGQDRKVIIWNKELTETGGNAGSSDWVQTELPAFDGPVWSVSWSPTGSMLGVAAGDEAVSLWKEELDGKWRNVSKVAADGASTPDNAN